MLNKTVRQLTTLPWRSKRRCVEAILPHGLRLRPESLLTLSNLLAFQRETESHASIPQDVYQDSLFDCGPASLPLDRLSVDERFGQ